MLQKLHKVKVKHSLDVELLSTLHVGICRDALKSIHAFDHSTQLLDTNQFMGVIFRDFCAIYDFVECLFVQVQVIDAPAMSEGKEIFLYVSEEFLNHYNFHCGDVLFFRKVNCFELDKVIFGSKSTKAFLWFKDESTYKKLISQCVSKNFIARKDDSLLITSSGSDDKDVITDFVTLDCYPFQQGLITLKTSLIAANINETTSHSRFDINLTTKPNMVSLGNYALSLINYTSSNFLGLRFPSTSSSTTFNPLSALNVLGSFEIRVMSKLNIHFQKEIINSRMNIDMMNTVFVSNKMGKELCLSNGSWVKISLLDPLIKSVLQSPLEPLGPSLTKQKPLILKRPSPVRLAQVCSFSDEKLSSHYFPSNKIVYISPSLWFNLNRHPSLLMQPHLRLQIEPVEPKSAPLYAKEATVNLIRSPNYSDNAKCNEMLSSYFETPRYIMKGDVISVDSREQMNFLRRNVDDDQSKLQSPIVHFRVSMIEVEGLAESIGYLLSSDRARLYQIGMKQSYVPVTAETYLLDDMCHPIWNSIPEGLMHYISALQGIILPFLKLQNEKCHLSSNILFHGPACSGKSTVVKAVCRCLNLHLYQVNCHELIGESTAAVEARLKNKFNKVVFYGPCVVLLKNIHYLGKEKEAPSTEDHRVLRTLADHLKNINKPEMQWPVVVIATSTEAKLNATLESAFMHTVQMNAPSEEERQLLLQDLLTICEVGNDVSIKFLAQRTAGFVLGDLCELVSQAIKHAYNRIREFVNENKFGLKDEEDLVLAAIPVVQSDLINALESLQSKFAESIGAPKIPNVKFEDVGGLAQVKQEILDTIQLPLEHPEILISGLRRSGVLLYGPPGSGKTLLAKAVATECSLNFLSVKGPELINMYVGQSEKNVRAVFEQARDAVPCIIFFDELDSLAPNRGRSGDSGGVMDRVVSQLLSELDGLNKKSEVFVIGATNRPDLLDPALLRPGRFDRLLYVGIPEDKKSKLNILKAITRKIHLASDVNLEEIVEKCPSNLSGADYYSLCSNAVIKRVEKNVELLEKGEVASDDLDNGVRTEDFLAALETLVPSVSPQQLQQYKDIKSKIENDDTGGGESASNVRNEDVMNALKKIMSSLSPQEIEQKKDTGENFENDNKFDSTS